jgi:membrane protein implicated in regulation of membrane protease activity
MITNILTILIAGFILFEVIEHVLFPLVWSVVARNRRSRGGIDGMLGKVVEVKKWCNGQGRVFVDGEIWKATSCDPQRPGDKAVVQGVDGLVLRIAGRSGPTTMEP